MRHTRIVTLLAAAGTGLLVAGGLAITGLVATGPAIAAIASAASDVAPPPPLPPGTISTIAGGRGGPGAATRVSVSPCALKYAGGSLYISTSYAGPSAVYRVSQRTGTLTAVAGSGTAGFGQPGPADGIPASEFTFDAPCGVTVDQAGNVLVADDDQVLAAAARTGIFYGRPMTAGRMYTVSSPPGPGGTTETGLEDVQIDPAGNLVMAEGGEAASHTNDETYAEVIVQAERTGTFYGRRMVRGKLYTVAGLARGGGQVPPGSFGPARRAAPPARPLAAGVPATQFNLGYQLGALRFDAAGNIVLADPGGNGAGAIGNGSDVPPMVVVIAWRPGTFYHRAMKAGYAYAIAGGGGKTPNGVPAASAGLRSASGVALDRDGNVLIADTALRVIAARNGTFYGTKMTAGDIYTLAALSPRTAGSVAVDDAGNVLFGGNLTAGAGPGSDRVYLLADKTGRFYGVRARAGRVYPVAGNGRPGYSGDGGAATKAEFCSPSAIAVNSSGTLTAVADGCGDAVRLIARASGRHFGRAMTAGDIYTVAGGGKGKSAAGGVRATSVALNGREGVAFDRAGNLVVSDGADDQVHVVANSTGTFYRQPMTAGDIYTVAGDGTDGFSGDGGPARMAAIASPQGVAVDKNGNVLLIDDSDRIRIVAARTGTFYGQPMTAGDIDTMAGTGTPGDSGDGGPAAAAEIQPQGITVDARGNLVVVDFYRVRVVAARAGTFYGQRMTAGDIYTVAGGGTGTADGTPALSADLHASAAAADPAGNLLVSYYGTVWMVAAKAGPYYGRTMRAGDIYTVADSVPGDVFRDGIPATRAQFLATGIVVQPGTGNLLMADAMSGRVRSVSR